MSVQPGTVPHISEALKSFDGITIDQKVRNIKDSENLPALWIALSFTKRPQKKAHTQKKNIWLCNYTNQHGVHKNQGNVMK